MPKQKRGSTRQPEALAMLIKDHRMVQKMFKDFEKLEPDSEDMRGLVKQACSELRVHSRMEEQTFYPAVRRAFQEKGRDVSLIAEAEVEHKVVADLLDELERMTNTHDEHYAATFSVLGEYVNHHIEEEEGKIFAEIRRAKMDLEVLAEEMRHRKETLRQEMGLGEAGESEEAADVREREGEAGRRRT